MFCNYGICLYGFASHSGGNHLLDISTISVSFLQVFMSRQTYSDTPYSSGKPDITIINFSSVVEDQEELMFAGNFSLCEKTFTFQSAVGCCFGIAADNLYRFEL